MTYFGNFRVTRNCGFLLTKVFFVILFTLTFYEKIYANSKNIKPQFLYISPKLKYKPMENCSSTKKSSENENPQQEVSNTTFYIPKSLDDLPLISSNPPILKNPPLEENNKNEEVQEINLNQKEESEAPAYTKKKAESKVNEWKADFNVGIKFSKIEIKPDYCDKTSNINYEVKFGFKFSCYFINNSFRNWKSPSRISAD